MSTDDNKALKNENNANDPSQPLSGTNNETNQPMNENQKHGFMPGSMPHIPTAYERAKDMDSRRRGNAHTFEL